MTYGRNWAHFRKRICRAARPLPGPRMPQMAGDGFEDGPVHHRSHLTALGPGAVWHKEPSVGLKDPASVAPTYALRSLGTFE